MKKLIVVTCALALAMSTMALAQQSTDQTSPSGSQTGQDNSKQPSTGQNTPKQQSASGKISRNGKTFTNDSDNKSYTVDNPEADQGYEGQHVIMLIHVDPDTNTVHILSLEPQK